MSEFALRVLVEFGGGETYVIGTATLIAPYVVLTAKHVLDEITTRFGTETDEDGTPVIADYSIRLYQCLPGPTYIIYQVVKAWSHPDTDISVLHLALFRSSSRELLRNSGAKMKWRHPPLAFGPPRLGERLAAFGYHSSKVDTRPAENGNYHLELTDAPTTSTGLVEEILPQGQPAGNFTFPCYRIAARFDGGMSGGPVFDQEGALCGIISGSLSPGDDQDEPISYVCMLWPILRLTISVNRGPKFPRNVKYPMAHLVRDGQLHVMPHSFNGIDPKLIWAWYSGTVSDS
ncbi:S1 family peptidase [Paraburkholderia guartelaensis]|nr:serine protease [Paraburkholderia guartelaensis]